VFTRVSESSAQKERKLSVQPAPDAQRAKTQNDWAPLNMQTKASPTRLQQGKRDANTPTSKAQFLLTSITKPQPSFEVPAPLTSPRKMLQIALQHGT